MANLDQLKISFDPAQDRLILIFFTQDFSEMRFWITRRMVKKLWGGLKQLQDTFNTSKFEQEHELQKAQEQVRQESIHQEANKYGMQMARSPLGAEPLLLTQVKISKTETGQVHFRFESSNGTHMDIATDKSFVSLLTQLIQKSMPHTEWDLTL